jgi:hypothetical protein
MADTDTAEMWAMVVLTMNRTVPTMVAGDVATRWRRFAAMAIVQPVETATHLRLLIDPRLLHARCHHFRRMVAVVALDVAVAVSGISSRLKTIYLRAFQYFH